MKDEQALRSSASPSGRTNQTLRRAALGLLVVIGLAILAEGGLRFVLGLGNPVLIAPDPACGYILKPDQHLNRFFAHTDVNHFGMRSEEVPAGRTPGSLRLLFVGDSITYGTSQVDQSRIFTELLHRELPSVVDRPVEVLNASAGAWAIDNELAYVRSRGTFQADVVVLVLNSGDLSQAPSTIAQVGDDLPARRPSTAIGELWTRFLGPRLFHLKRHIDAGDSAAENADAQIRANLDELEGFRALVAAQHGRFVVVYAPFRKDIPVVAAKSGSVLMAWATAHQVPLLDLTGAEAPYTVREITLDGDHFNAKGNRIVADAIKSAWPGIVPPR